MTAAAVPGEEELTTILREALVALGRAGRPQEANRLAARAWSLLRGPAPEQAKRINRTMHALARMETGTGNQGEQR